MQKQSSIPVAELQPIDPKRTEGAADAFPHSLGIHRGYPSHAQNINGLRARRFAMLAAVRELLPDSPARWCLKTVRKNIETLEVRYLTEKKRAYIHGLATCGLIWPCPICAARMTETRRVELQGLIAAARSPYADVPRFHLAMLTFTIQHHKGESCVQVLNRQSKAFGKWAAGRWYQGFKANYFILGTLRALETTHGESAGWHPHFHLLLVMDSYLNDARRGELVINASVHWQEMAASVGGYADPLHGCDLSYDPDPTYLGKLTGVDNDEWDLISEVSKQPVKQGRKGGRTMTQLLADYTFRDDIRAGELWIEAQGAHKGKRYWHTSNGFWELLGRDEMMSDQKAARQDMNEAYIVLAYLSRAQWKVIILQAKENEVWDMADAGDPELLWKHLESIGVDRGGE